VPRIMPCNQEVNEPQYHGCKAAWIVFGIGVTLPFITFYLAGFFGQPDWRGSWFAPSELPTLTIGFLCCVSAPLLVAASWRRRALLSTVAAVCYGVAYLIAMCLGVVAFGLPASL